jgi:hypothetical protein
MLMKLSSVYYYKARMDSQDAPTQDELTRLAEEHRRWGFRKMFSLLAWAGYAVESQACIAFIRN